MRREDVNAVARALHVARVQRVDSTYALQALERLAAELERRNTIAAETECLSCGALACPHGEAFHYHHDGCPSCLAKEPF